MTTDTKYLKEDILNAWDLAQDICDDEDDIGKILSVAKDTLIEKNKEKYKDIDESDILEFIINNKNWIK